MHISSYQKMERFVAEHLAARESLRILDLGGQDVNGSYRPLFEKPGWTYHGADMVAGSNVDIVLADPYDWVEVEDAAYDVLVSGQVFEHIEYFWVTMLEVRRVLKPGGITCILAPSRGPEHQHPKDCYRYYPDGVKAMAAFAKLDVLEASTEWMHTLKKPFWKKRYYKDKSERWGDTKLVAQKPRLAPEAEAKMRAAHAALLELIR